MADLIDSYRTLSVNSNSLFGNSFLDESTVHMSPPKDKIISRIDLKDTESTDKLSLFPKELKTNEDEKVKLAEKENDSIQNALSKRFLNYNVYGDEYKPDFVSNEEVDDNVVNVKVIMDGIINSLAKLNRLIKAEDPLPAETICEKYFHKLVSYNSLFALTTFDDIKEVHKTPDSVLYSVKHRLDNRMYIIKSAFIDSPLDNCDTLTHPNLFKLREAQILSAIDHENIVRFHGVWFENQAIFIQLEYMLGASLHYIWYGTNKHNQTCYGSNIILPELSPPGNKLSNRSARKLIKHIASALDYIHREMKLVHNHINSSHIFAAFNFPINSVKEEILNETRTCVIRDITNGHSRFVNFKLFDFSRSFAIEEQPIPRQSKHLCFLNSVKHKPYYKDMFAFGVVLAEVFLNRDDFYEIDFLNDSINTESLTSDDDLNNVIGKLLSGYDETNYLSSEELVALVQSW